MKVDMIMGIDLSHNVNRLNYGSINAGLMVAKYRSERVKFHCKNSLLSYEDATKEAHADVIAEFGPPLLN